MKKLLLCLIIFLSLLMFRSNFAVANESSILQLKKYIKLKSLICLVEIDKDSVIIIENSWYKGPVRLLICKIHQIYKNDFPLSSDLIEIYYLPLNCSEADFIIQEPENDLVQKITFNRKIILTTYYNQELQKFVTNNYCPNNYIDKEPGKSLYKYLEKKYRKKK